MTASAFLAISYCKSQTPSVVTAPAAFDISFLPPPHSKKATFPHSPVSV